MGHQTLVYGAIEVWASYPEVDAVNQEALDGLPEEEDEWPFLVRSMFSATVNRKLSVQYIYRVIHFGASYKEVELEWDQWLSKFERLLSKMCGVTATVHLETERDGNHTYEWVNKHSNPKDPRSPTSWEFLGGTRQFFEPRLDA